MDTKELLKKVRKIEIKTRRLSNHIFGGEYHSTFKGRGMTFSEVRQYQYGDDIRAIDWNVTARYNEAHIKVFEEERELTMMLLVDISGSEFFGTSNQFKKDTITEIAATLAFSATKNNDNVGLILFSDKMELYIPPKKGKSHVLRIIRELIEFKPKSKQTNITEGLKFLSSITKKKAIVFVLSDFMDDAYQHTLKLVSKKHDVTGIRIFDKHEQEIPSLGMVPMTDAETGETFLVNTSAKSVRNQYKENALQLANYFESSFKKSGAGTINIQVDQSYVKKLLGYFKRK
ncbi:DUF58 domain-containing protein [Tenacibaculum finnmarkense]|uniref:VWFA domain-containing protein n=1 Tax=Tenacibaculum finnmarkense genomovar ulcerans TaxID=2781388 RepID=A0A2I2M6K1_9FLAO|nr:DUF58 domain-containing protein [Tenacibaculum finnmarkense]ALU75969.1 hypothetical protein AUW17_12235 [Tenacibaculum dicentrarchi]MBE7696563.1 DUF58 domain-containing protein [Tenacibaculum finnmarkense genomovar ulcerans]MCG8235972.1 DUF58 domain-containing protein [Tenacibaculum finnmarkense genomovar ulcerans]MCG8802423.1 DUF58 domain-containing protein [Tenacibaculum finnmarkense]MCG8807226.1 DUF58 domain-containing protein [Tenacibaculum finnmarkense]